MTEAAKQTTGRKPARRAPAVDETLKAVQDRASKISTSLPLIGGRTPELADYAERYEAWLVHNVRRAEMGVEGTDGHLLEQTFAALSAGTDDARRNRLLILAAYAVQAARALAERGRDE
ncbi:hypothetical protein AB0J38_29830 [Streptomyces sp. NPDC050095]|uniref:hypothetical protein n=1 Tax=unclassified Streptomyces TaxID=2593676 RepID=UPI003416A9CE